MVSIANSYSKSNDFEEQNIMNHLKPPSWQNPKKCDSNGYNPEKLQKIYETGIKNLIQAY
jgi:hypothetical protein